MKNKRKNKINILKNISILKKDLLNPKIFSNNYKPNTNINNKSGSISSKLSYKIEILNNINTENEYNAQEILEKLYREELNKFKIVDSKKEKLTSINLKEENANELYNWDSLLKRKISFEKRKELNKNILNKKFTSFNKIDYNSIDYTKGMNVLSQTPNEVLLKYYKDILRNRKNAPEISPKIKLKHKNNIYHLINSQKISLSDKEKYLNFLTLIEKENNNFTNHDLKIAYKRKTADVLIKAYMNYNNINNKKIENSKNDNHTNYKSQKDKKMKKKKGLILSLYDENNPEIKKFDEEIHSLSQQNLKKIDLNYFDDLNENLKYDNKRKIFSAKDLKARSILSNDLSQDKEGFKSYISGTTNLSINTLSKINKRKTFNFFKDKQNKGEYNFSLSLNSNKTNKIKKNALFRPMSSSNLMHTNNNNLYFLNNKPNKKSMSYQDYEEIGFMNVFPRKKSSKVGNNMYDKINKILKYRFMKKFKLNSKQYSKNLISKTINNKYYKKKEESKSNKIIQAFLSENLRTSISKTTDSEMLNSVSKYRDNERSSSKRENKKNNFFSCSNNYIVDIKRKNKQKFLNELSDKDYLNEMMNEIIFEDKFTQKESTKRIKSIYAHNE
jgi:hypothetical protein